MAAKALVVSALVSPLVLLGGIGAVSVVVASSSQAASGRLPEGSVPLQYAGLIERYGRSCQGLTPSLLAAQLYQESSFNPRSVSSANAMGIAQFLPDTWQKYGVDMNGDGQANVFDPVDAIPAAARYDCNTLRAIREQKIPGDPVDNMFAAYNAGFHRMTLRYTAGTPWPAETQDYVAKIHRYERTTFAPVAGVVAPSQAAAVAIQFARAQLGTPYLWGGTGTPEQDGRFDCSGLMLASYHTAGVNLHRTSREQWYDGPHVPREQLQPGDLVFFAWNTRDPSSIHHVGMYVGGGFMIDAPHTGALVRFDRVDTPDYIGAVRPTLQ